MITAEEFYPTPKAIIRKMIEPYKKLSDLTILDPSAGRGGILDFIRTRQGEHYLPNFYCCEIDKDLQFQLREKKYKLIAEDFLEYRGDYYFDLILMNPPFSNGDEHLLHAWDILIEGDICCLLNAETLLNPYSEKRKLLAKIIEDNQGTVEDLGDCFFTAERRTSVQVSMVRLKKKAKDDKLRFNFEPTSTEAHPELTEDTLKNEIATRDVIQNMVIQYEALKIQFVSHIKGIEGLQYYSQGLLTDNESIMGIVENSLNGMSKCTPHDKYNSFCDNVKQELWKTVINKMGMDRYMTANVRENFSQFIEQQGAMDFTKENVLNIVKTLLLNGSTILDKAVVDVFDIFTKYYDENRSYPEGWKTNDSWKVNRRVILPRFVENGWGDNFTTSGRYNEYSDIDRVMCYLTGKHYEDFTTPVKDYPYGTKDIDKEFKIMSLEQAVKRTRCGDSSRKESEFFFLRCYKKGTLHIEFKDKDLWDRFNIKAVEGKKWLPDSTE
jgi:hypothetical protein